MNLSDQTCHLPFKGQAGTSKKRGCCPHCGADARAYRYPVGSRWKHCYRCGYDRLQQKGFEHTRWLVRHNREVNPEWLRKATDYYQKVYGQPKAKTLSQS